MITHSEEMRIYNEALDLWPEIQERQWIEEMAEAIQAFCHWKRGRCGFAELVKEFSHVQFCIKQMLVCISRETGCSYRDLTQMLVDEEDLSFVRLQARLQNAIPYDTNTTA